MRRTSLGVWLGLIGLGLLGFGLFVMGRGASGPSAPQAPSEPQTPAPPPSSDLPKAEGLIVSASFGVDSADIYTTDVSTGKRRKVFTDSDETLKIKTVAGITFDVLWTLATLGEKSAERGSTLALLDLTGKGKKQILLSDFGASGTPVIDPLGKKVAYVVFSNAEPDYGYSLLTMNTDGSNRQRLARSEGIVGNPAFSPDGNKIAYTVETSGGTDLAVADATGKNAKTVLTLSGETMDAVSWSADRIAYASMPKKEGSANEGEIWRVGTDGSGKTRVTQNNRHDTTPAFSPDGNFLAFVGVVFEGGKISQQGDGDVYFATKEGKNETKLFSGDEILGWKK